MPDNAHTLQTQLDALKATLLAQDFDSLTPEGVQDMLRAFIEDELGLSTAEGTLLQIILAPGAYVFWEGLQALRAQVPISFVDETSGSFIDKDAAGYGITRKPGTAASVTLTFTGSAGTTVPAGTLCVTQDGLGFATDEDLTLGEDGSGTVTATADAVGTAYNVLAGAIVSTQQAVSGVTSLTNEAAAAGGTDPETDAALFARLDAYKKTPPTSGNDRHYHQWALEVNGVGAASVIRCWDGPGTVKVIIADMALHPVTEELRAEVAAYIETQRTGHRRGDGRERGGRAGDGQRDRGNRRYGVQIGHRARTHRAAGRIPWRDRVHRGCRGGVQPRAGTRHGAAGRDRLFWLDRKRRHGQCAVGRDPDPDARHGDGKWYRGGGGSRWNVS